jgi:uncharacterized membrane protein
MLSYLKSHNTIFLALFSLFSIMLVSIRFLLIDKTDIFLVMNLGLAWIPYLLSYVFTLKKINKLVLILIGVIWLLFFPNALYMVTDLFQLRPRVFVNIWFDLMMLLSFALVGLFLGFSSLKNVENLMTLKFGKRKAQLSIIIVMYLGSLGVYFGRFIRLNSWEVFSMPAVLIRKVLNVFSNPFYDANFYATTLVFTIFCYFLYYGLYHFAKNQ